LARLKLLAFAVTCLLGAGLLAVGCGGSDEDPEEVLTQTFDNDETAESGVINMTISASAEGATGGSAEATLSGPFQTTEDPLGELDLTATASAEGLGQSFDFEGGVTATGDGLFVNYQGTDYEVPPEFVEQLNAVSEEATPSEDASTTEACVQGLELQGFDSASAGQICDFDFSTLFTNLENEGDEDVEGAETTHISGDVDFAAVGSLVSEIAAASPQAGALPPGAIDAAVGQLDEAVTEASFDLYSGADDSILRQLDLNFALAPPEESAGLLPVDSVNFDLSVVVSGVNEPQTIEAPTDAQPLDGLLDELGASGLPLGDLGALPGGGGTFDLDGPGGVTPGGSGGGGAAAGGAANEAYLDCIQSATTPDEIAGCVNEL